MEYGYNLIPHPLDTVNALCHIICLSLHTFENLNKIIIANLEFEK